MLLTLRGLPPDVKMSEICCFIRERCTVMWFLLEGLEAQVDGMRSVKVATMSDADAAILCRELSGERLGAYTLSVEPSRPAEALGIHSQVLLPEGEIKDNEDSPDGFEENKGQLSGKSKVGLGKRNISDSIDAESMGKRRCEKNVSEVGSSSFLETMSEVVDCPNSSQNRGESHESCSSHENGFVAHNKPNELQGDDEIGGHNVIRANSPHTYNNRRESEHESEFVGHTDPKESQGDDDSGGHDAIRAKSPHTCNNRRNIEHEIEFVGHNDPNTFQGNNDSGGHDAMRANSLHTYNNRRESEHESEFVGHTDPKESQGDDDSGGHDAIRAKSPHTCNNRRNIEHEIEFVGHDDPNTFQGNNDSGGHNAMRANSLHTYNNRRESECESEFVGHTDPKEYQGDDDSGGHDAIRAKSPHTYNNRRESERESDFVGHNDPSKVKGDDDSGGHDDVAMRPNNPHTYNNRRESEPESELVGHNDPNKFKGNDDSRGHDAIRANSPHAYDDSREIPSRALEGFVYAGHHEHYEEGYQSFEMDDCFPEAEDCNPGMDRIQTHLPHGQRRCGQNPELSSGKVPLWPMKQKQVKSPRKLPGQNRRRPRSCSPSFLRGTRPQTEIQPNPSECPPTSTQSMWPVMSHVAPQIHLHEHRLDLQQIQPHFNPPNQIRGLPPQIDSVIQPWGIQILFDRPIQPMGMQSQFNPRVQLIGIPPHFDPTIQHIQSMGIPPQLENNIQPRGGQPQFDPPFQPMDVQRRFEPPFQPMDMVPQIDTNTRGMHSRFNPSIRPQGMQHPSGPPVQPMSMPPELNSTIQPMGTHPQFGTPIQSMSTQPRSGPPVHLVGMPSQHDSTIRPIGMQPRFGPPVQSMGTQPRFGSPAQLMGMPPQHDNTNQPMGMQPRFDPPFQSMDTKPRSGPPVELMGMPPQHDNNIQPIGMQPTFGPPVQSMGRQPPFGPPVQLMGMPPQLNSTIQPMGIQPQFGTPIQSMSTQPRSGPPVHLVGMPSQHDSTIRPIGMQPRFGPPVQSMGTQPRFGSPAQLMGMPPQHDSTNQPMGMQPRFDAPIQSMDTLPRSGTPVELMGMPPQLDSTIQPIGMQPRFGPPVQSMGTQPRFGPPAQLMGMPSQHDSTIQPMDMEPRFAPPVQSMDTQPPSGPPVQLMGMPTQHDSTIQPIGMQPRFGPLVQSMGTHCRFGPPFQMMGLLPKLDSTIHPMVMQARFGPPVQPMGTRLSSGPPVQPIGMQPIASLPTEYQSTGSRATSLMPNSYTEFPLSYKSCSSNIFHEMADIKNCMAKNNSDVVVFANSMKFLICKRLWELTNEDPSVKHLIPIYRKHYPPSTDKETMKIVCKQLSLPEIPVPLEDSKFTVRVLNELRKSKAFDDIVEGSVNITMDLSTYINTNIKVDADADNRTDDDVKAEHFRINSAELIAANLLMPQDRGKKNMNRAERLLRPHLEDLIVAELKKLPREEFVDSQDSYGAFLVYHRNTSPARCRLLIDMAIEKFGVDRYNGTFTNKVNEERAMELWPDLYIVNPRDTPATLIHKTAVRISKSILVNVRIRYASIVIASEVYAYHQAEYQKLEAEFSTDDLQQRMRSRVERRLRELVQPEASDASTRALVALYRSCHPPEGDARLLCDVIAELRAEAAGETDDTRRKQSYQSMVTASGSLASEAAYRRQLTCDERRLLTAEQEELLTWLQSAVQGRIDRILSKHNSRALGAERIRAAYRARFPWRTDGALLRAVVALREAKTFRVARTTGNLSGGMVDEWRNSCVCQIADEVLFGQQINKEQRRALSSKEKRQIKVARKLVQRQFEQLLEGGDNLVPSCLYLRRMYRGLHPKSEDAALKARVLIS